MLLVSADLEELIGLADRLVVMLRGRMVAELDPATTTPRILGGYMTSAAGEATDDEGRTADPPMDRAGPGRAGLCVHRVLGRHLVSVVLLIAGTSPLEAWLEMLSYGTRLETLVETANRATQLYLAGIAVAIGFRMNLFNIGVEGQYVLAALLSACGGRCRRPAGNALHVALIMLVAMTVGSSCSQAWPAT